MNAELCRRLAAIKSTPHWYYLASLSGGTASDQWQAKANQLTNEAVKAVDFDKLSAEIQELIQQCETSVAISKRLFGDKYASSLSHDELERISRELFKDEPVEEVN